MNRGTRLFRSVWQVFVVLVLAACTTPQPVQVMTPDDLQQLSDLVGDYSRVAALQPEDQRREYAGASRTFSRDPTPYNRIRVALLASMPGTSFQDDVRAMSLLAPYAAAGPTYDKLRQFGAMLHAQLAERAKTRARADQLREQLDALRAVERTIIERGQPAPKPKQ